MDHRANIRKGTAVFLLLLLLTAGISIAASTATPNARDRRGDAGMGMRVNQTYYVDDNNTEGPWDGTPEHPYQHISDAVRVADDRDTIFVFKGSYLEQVVLNNSVNLVGEEKGSTIIDGGGLYDGTVIFQADNITLRGFTIQGSRWIAGIWIENTGEHHSNRNLISGNILCRNTIYALMIDGSSDNVLANNVFVDNVEGVKVWLSNSRTVFSNNTFLNNSMEISGAPTSIVVSENMFEAGDLVLEDGSDITIRDNVFRDCPGLTLDRSAGVVVHGNRFYNSKGLNIVQLQWGNSNVTGNTINDQPIYAWYEQADRTVPADAMQVILADCQRITVDHLTLTESYGIQLFSSTGIRIINNTVTRTPGIQLVSSPHNVLTNNTSTALFLTQSSDNLLSGNEISDDGITSENSSNNTFTYNLIHNCSTGMTIKGGTNTQVASNHFQDNIIAIQLRGTSNNDFSANNFLHSMSHHVDFVADGLRHCHNTWKRNYWDNHRLPGPKLVFGSYDSHVRLKFYSRYWHDYFYWEIFLPGFNLDLLPARQPYPIPAIIG